MVFCQPASSQESLGSPQPTGFIELPVRGTATGNPSEQTDSGPAGEAVNSFVTIPVLRLRGFLPSQMN